MSDHILDQIDAELKRKFPSHERLESETPSDAGFVLYSYLLKQLPFNVNFERLDFPLKFQTTEATVNVEGFGVDTLTDVGLRLENLVAQVDILDHVSDADFILRLRTRGHQDEIILAKIPAKATLSEMVATANARIAMPATNGFRRDLGGGDRLAIPVLRFAVDRRYSELEGLEFVNPELIGLPIVTSRQVIKFRLDETGAVIESEAIVIGENGDSHIDYDARKARQLVFDRPFLLFVRETQAKAPYLVMWIANDVLMEQSRKK